MGLNSSTGNKGRKKCVKRISNFDTKLLTHIVFAKVLPTPSNKLKDDLKISRQVLNYHIKKLIDSDLIKIAVRDAQNFYEPTDKGKTYCVKKPILCVGEPILGLHNIAFKFKILHGKPFKLRKSIKLKGWTKHHCFFDGCYVEKTTKNLIICPIKKGDRLMGKDPFILQQEARDRAMKIAQHFTDRYDLTLSKPRVCRKPHFGVQDPIARAVPFEVSTKEAKMDDSEGIGGEIDFLTPQGARAYLDTVTVLPRKVDRMDEKVDRILGVLEVYAENMEAHTMFIRKSASIMRKLDIRLSQRRLSEFV